MRNAFVPKKSRRGGIARSARDSGSKKDEIDGRQAKGGEGASVTQAQVRRLRSLLEIGESGRGTAEQPDEAPGFRKGACSKDIQELELTLVQHGLDEMGSQSGRSKKTVLVTFPARAAIENLIESLKILPQDQLQKFLGELHRRAMAKRAQADCIDEFVRQIHRSRDETPAAREEEQSGR